MTRVMAVTFERHGQLHYLRADDGQYAVGDNVLYPTIAGPEVAQVIWAPEPSTQDGGDFPECLGHATAADLKRDADNRASRAKARLVAKRLAAAHHLDLKVVAVDLVDRGPDAVTAIYYTAPDRVDFRALVPELAGALGSRIDMRQIGARDAASVVGGIGSCGRELCCSTFLKKVEPVSLRLARDQNLPNNPLQISGACGKLMCCLKYEHPLYTDFAARAPRVGDDVQTDQGRAKVVGHSVPTDSVVVRQSSGEVRRCPLESVCPSSQARKQRTKKLAAETTQEM